MGIRDRLKDINERRYRQRVPLDAQQFIEEHEMELPDSYVDGGARFPHLTDSMRAILYGELLSEERARELGVPRDVGRIAAKGSQEV